MKIIKQNHGLIFTDLRSFYCKNLDESFNDQETVRNIQCCYLYALYIQMLTTRTQSQAKTIFRNLLQVQKQ